MSHSKLLINRVMRRIIEDACLCVFVSCIRLLQGIHLPSVVRLRPKRLNVLIFPIL